MKFMAGVLSKGLILEGIKAVTLRIMFHKFFAELDNGKLLFFAGVQLVDKFIMNVH
jgi:hypothetical protein